MDQNSYRDCMAKWMRGPKEIAPGASAMCVGAKICTGKAADIDEAIRICAVEPKKPATRKGFTKGAKCLSNLDEVVDCLMGKMNWQANDFKGELRKSMSLCMCGSKAVKKSRAEEALKQIPEEALQALASIQGIFGDPKKKVKEEPQVGIP